MDETFCSIMYWYEFANPCLIDLMILGFSFSFTAPFLVRMLMVFLRSVGLGAGHPNSFPHVILQVRGHFRIDFIKLIYFG